MLTGAADFALDLDDTGDGSAGVLTGIEWQAHVASDDLAEGEEPGSGSGSGGGGGPCSTPTLTVEDGTANEGAEFLLVVHGAISGGCLLTGYDIDWGDGGPVEYFSHLDQLAHVYADDNPTATPDDDYTVAVTAYWDDNQTASDSGTVTVFNVAPVVTIDYVDESVNENESFLIQGTITDAGVEDTIVQAVLLVDLNFDGDTLDDGETISLDLVSVGPGQWTFETATAAVPDDGATYDPETGDRIWGNGTGSDTLPFTIEVEDDDSAGGSTGDTTEVFNVAPIIAEFPQLSYELDALGYVVSATASGTYSGPGSVDFHQVTVVGEVRHPPNR